MYLKSKAAIEAERLKRLHRALMHVRDQVNAGAPRMRTLYRLRTRHLKRPGQKLSKTSLRRIWYRWIADPCPEVLRRNYAACGRSRAHDVSWWLDRAVAMIAQTPTLPLSTVLHRLNASVRRAGDRWPLSERTFRLLMTRRLGLEWRNLRARHAALRARFSEIGRERASIVRQLRDLETRICSGSCSQR